VAPVRVLVQVGLERVELARARPLPAAVDEFLPGHTPKTSPRRKWLGMRASAMNLNAMKC
jgi:hypothetical protein